MDGRSDKKILEVPHLSQILDVKDGDWHNRACGVTALAMLIEFYSDKENSSSLDDLIKEGLSLGGHDDRYGWIHSFLVLLAYNHGLCAHQEEFKSSDKSFEEKLSKGGMEKFKKSILNAEPVIVSVDVGFRHNKTTHLIVLTGIKIEEGSIKGFYFHDPQSEERGDGEHEFVALDRFKEYWRKMAIFVSKNP
jgi:hypothetical protein